MSSEKIAEEEKKKQKGRRRWHLKISLGGLALLKNEGGEAKNLAYQIA